MLLYEKYRPTTLDGIIGQDKAVSRVKSLACRGGLAGRAYWISGASGTGKTTIARVIASEITSDPLAVMEIDASECTPARLREIERSWATFSFGGGGRAYIVNEAHGLRADTTRQLLVMLERIPDHVAVIFTTTTDGQEGLFESNIDACPLLSRCITLALTNQGLCRAFADHCRRIAQAENLDGQPITAYEKLAKKHKNNCRAMLQDIDAGIMCSE